MKTESNSLRVVEASAPPSQLGFELGTQCKDLAQQMVEDYRQELKQRHNLEWDKAKVAARKYLAFCQDSIPAIVEELQGYARGAELSLDDVFTTVFWDYSGEKERISGCTDFVVSANLTQEKHVFMAHNEDFNHRFANYLCLVRAKPQNAPAFLSVTPGGILFGVGLNSAGLGFSGNGLSPNDTRVGIPSSMIFHAMYGARTIVEALTYANLPHKGSSDNYVVADNNSQIYSIEGSATDFELIYAIDGYLVHTNHYVTQKMRRYEGDFLKFVRGYMCSVCRYNRALSLLRESEEISLQRVMEILRDHANSPCSICRHVDEKVKVEDRMKTIYSTVVDVTAQEMWVCYGNPCLGEYHRYTL